MVVAATDQVLSQDEVNALLSAVTEGEIETETDEEYSDSDVVLYDLTSQDRIIRGRMPTLDIIHDRFARNFRISLSNSLRRIIDINMESTSLTKFGEFLNSLPIPSCLNLVKFHPLHGIGLLIFEAKLLYSLANLFFGGSELGKVKVEGREFSPIELQLVKRLVILMIHDLTAAWKNVYPVDIQFLRTEINPQFVGVVPPTDVVVAVTFEVELDKTRGKIFLMIPYSSIEPIRERLSSAIHSEQLEVDKSWQKRIITNVSGAHIKGKAILGTSEISVKEMMHLKVGDVIELNNDVSDELTFYVEGIPKFLGYPVISHNKYALQISKFFTVNQFFIKNDK